MKAADYRQMSDEQLDLSLKDLVKNLFHLRFQSATDRLETPSEITKAKREVARIRTVIRERTLGVRGQKPTTQLAAPQGAKA
jgi:large subunit ribosomal protein L29